MVIKNQHTGKISLNPENVSETMTCSRSALHQPLVWALSFCSLCSVSPTWLWDSLCFPTYQEMNSEIEIRDEQILPWLLLCWFSSGPWYVSLVQMPRNAPRRARLPWRAQRKSRHGTSQKVFLNQILNIARGFSSIQPAPPKYLLAGPKAPH